MIKIGLIANVLGTNIIGLTMMYVSKYLWLCKIHNNKKEGFVDSDV